MPQSCCRCRKPQELEAFVDGDGVVRKSCETCREAGRKRFKSHYKANAPAVAARIATYRSSREPAVRRAAKAAENRRWRRKYPAKKAAANRTYRRQNRGKVAALSLKRKARIAQATPAWADLAAIEAVYDRAARLRAEGHKVEVHHVHPLAGRKVCGLHVHTNLRIVSKSFNMLTSNKHESDHD